MPITVNMELEEISQDAFGKIAYEVMSEVFALHRSMGCLFKEHVYQNALAKLIPESKKEVRIDVSFRDFNKPYYMDLVVSNGAVFELKATNALSKSHRTQLLNYLLLSGLHHGKLINCGGERVEHEFINTQLTYEKRRSFVVDDTEWQPTNGFGKDQKALLTEIIRDWGTGLSRPLYEEAFVYMSGGEENVYKELIVHLNDLSIAHERAILCGQKTAIKVTTFESNLSKHHSNLLKFLNCKDLDGIQWVNIALNKLSFITLK
jgi:GxxExxY protein